MIKLKTFFQARTGSTWATKPLTKQVKHIRARFALTDGDSF